ncbi:MAG TPA: hypothetical protein VK392_11165, partial [Thermoanaerobaculia bacterium]|nr:hypothetical protein [Thermoanaerobaculia bacterium]
MPEGNTIFRAARALDRSLAGKRVLSFEPPFPRLANAAAVCASAALGVAALLSVGCRSKTAEPLP